MAALNFTAISLRPPEKSYGTGNHRNSISFLPGRRPMQIAAAANSVESSPTLPEKPEIELEFIGEKPGSDGSYPVERAKAVSGEKLLRNIMLDNKIELYAPYISQRPTRVAFSPMNLLSGEEHGKLMNCGGGGSCGTCIVEIIDGKDLLNERTNTELRYLKKKPESWRLACQTIVGNKENSGKVVVQRLPQWKK